MSKEITEADFIDLALKTLGHGLIPVGRANFKLANEYAKSQWIACLKWVCENYEYSKTDNAFGSSWVIDEGVNEGFDKINPSKLYDLFIQHQSQQP